MVSQINCNGHLINLETPIVMGVLNLTPDSFYDGNTNINILNVEQKINLYISEGVTIIDIGAVSTRPGINLVSEKEEWNRLLPALKIIQKYRHSVVFSLDTFRSQLAKEAINEYGISIINDISAGSLDEKMFSTIAELKVPYIIMHMQGTPETMQNNPQYNNIIQEICMFFSEKIAQLKLLGVNDIIIDPGFGFGKTLEQNYSLLNNLNTFKIFDLPLLVGMSRKSMIYKHLGTTPEHALNGTTVVNTIALLNGADFLRVHDVKEAVETIKILEKMNKF